MTTAALVTALLLLLTASRVAARRERAPRLPPPPAGEPPEVMVLLPARNEEADVGECVESLLAQTAAPRVVLIDDGSTDATVERAREAAGRTGAPERLTVVQAGDLPDGWGGKVHALQKGLEAAESLEPRPDFYLSTDADTRHHPEALARALAALDAFGLDAVSLAARQEARGLENLLTPPVFLLLDALLGDWGEAARGEGATVANGQYVLLTRTALLAIDGFAAVADRPLDDVELARALRAHGFRTGFLRAPEHLSTRMYRGLGATFRGWRRNLGLIFGGRSGSAAALVAALAAPPLVAVALLAAGRPVAAVLVWTAGAAASVSLRTGDGQSRAWGLVWPLDALTLAAALGLGAADFRRGTLPSWKGRKLRVDPAQAGKARS